MADQDRITVPFNKEELKTMLQPQFEEDITVESLSAKYLTKPGDNYGSTMFALEVSIHKIDKSAEEVLHIVAKTVPPTTFLQIQFDIRNTFCKEMSIYKLVGPEMIKLQKESEFVDEDIMDILPKFYGARTTLSGDQDLYADINSVLLLENLSTSGFKLADRLSGLDLKHCQLVISKLAQFHAMPIALKQKKPHVYEQTVLRATAEFQMGGRTNDEQDQIEDMMSALSNDFQELKPYLDRIREHTNKYFGTENRSLNKEPFATIVHNDLWTNNMMFSYDDNSQPIGIKFVDFQVTLLCSPVKDLIFFISSSASTEVKTNFYEHLIELYYRNFISTLKKVGCNTNEFSFDKFQEEIKEFAPSQFLHILFMMIVIYAEKGRAKQLSEVKDVDSIMSAPSDKAKAKVLEHIKEFEQRGWF